MALEVIPCTLTQLNQCVAALHRHHKPVRGHRFSLAVRVRETGVIVGACCVGRPVARKTPQYDVAEVTRLVTDGTKNSCSILYAAAARACAAMGFLRIQTFILDTEPGTSLRAAGWQPDGYSDGAHGWQSRGGRRDDQPTQRKQRWKKEFPRDGSRGANPVAATAFQLNPKEGT
jgi:hypothetical protein